MLSTVVPFASTEAEGVICRLLVCHKAVIRRVELTDCSGDRAVCWGRTRHRTETRGRNVKKLISLASTLAIIAIAIMAIKCGPTTINGMLMGTDPGAKYTPEVQEELDRARLQGAIERIDRLPDSAVARKARIALNDSYQWPIGSPQWDKAMYEAVDWALTAEISGPNPSSQKEQQ